MLTEQQSLYYTFIINVSMIGLLLIFTIFRFIRRPIRSIFRRIRNKKYKDDVGEYEDDISPIVHKHENCNNLRTACWECVEDFEVWKQREEYEKFYISEKNQTTNNN